MAPQNKTPQVPWSAIREAPVVLMTGPEAFVADRAARLLLERIRSVSPDVDVVDIDGSTGGSGEITLAVSPSLFGEPRMVRVWSVEKVTDPVLDELLNYLAQPDPTVTLLVRHGGGNRAKKLLDTIRAHGGDWLEVTCPEVKSDRDRAQFLRGEAKSHRVVIEPDAEVKLLDAFQRDIAELAAAIGQLVADVGETGRITGALVERYYGGRVETSSFDIANLAISGNQGQALTALRQALNHGVEPILIVSALAHSLRTMARVGGKRGSPDDIAKDLGMKAWQVSRARNQLQGWDDVGLGQAIREVAFADAALKGLGHDPDWQLEKMVGLVAHRGHQPA
jgi:DNA polymerase III subunit delta